MKTDAKFEGIDKLYKEKATKLSSKHVLIIGLGGVGSWCAEFLVRSSISKLTLVDMDDICYTNINRQTQATVETVGQLKVDALKRRLLSINPDAEIHAIQDFFTPESHDKILSADYDFIVDAFDSVKYKALLLSECMKRNLPVITCGAAGGKKDMSQIQIKNFKRSYNDKLIAAVRRELSRNYKEAKKANPDFYIPSVFSPEQVFISDEDKGGGINCRGSLGSAGHVTAAFGLMATNYILDYFENE